jgi:AmmeMemoRadiSam system protein B
MAIASIRPAAVAGHFYPDDPVVLHAQIGRMLAAALPLESIPLPKALIVPHAGYIYSGPVAAAAYAAAARLREQVRRVVLLGPAHRAPVDGFALPAAQVFATPLGEIPLSRNDWVALQGRPDVVVDDGPHHFEHSLEVQLPFLQTILGAFELVPLLVGEASPEQVEEVLAALWGGPETLVVISSDLSHYLTYDQARHCDRATVEHIVRLQGPIGHQQACGATPVNGLLRAAVARGLEPHLLDLRNSGDTAGDRSRVVGYASVAFCETSRHAHAVRH